MARGCGIYPDCNDGNSAIHPHAVETIGDNIDYNCDNVSVLKNGWTDIEEDFSGGLDNWTLWGTPLPELIVSRGDPAPALWTRGDNMCDSGAYSDSQFNWIENRWKVSAEGMISNMGSNYNVASLRIMSGFATGGACAGDPISSYHVYISSDSGGAVIYGDALAETTVPDMINAGEWHLMEISNYKAY